MRSILSTASARIRSASSGDISSVAARARSHCSGHVLRARSS
ncbi:hypothetical protein [Nocardiopsis alba]